MNLTRRDFLTRTGTAALAMGVGHALSPRLASGQMVSMKIGTAVLGDYSLIAPIIVAQEKGFFKENGVTAEFTPFRGGPDLLKAVQANQIQVGITGSTDVPVFRSRGVPIRCIAVTVNSNHFTFNVAPRITKLADLKGKSIGVTVVGASTWCFATMLAKREGWEPGRDIKIVPLGGLDAQLAALARGEVEAFVWGDAGAMLELQGKSKVLMRLDAVTPKWFSQAVYCIDDYIKGNKDAIRRTVRALFQGVKFIRESSPEAIKITAKVLGWPEEGVARAHQQISGPLFNPDGRIDVEALGVMQNTLIELGVVKNRVALEDHYTPEFTPVRL